ncbi:calcium-translocating P-type ATPase PMCA-type [Penicillium soppii]|uniref:calcium-translocating P-type ATPase PMCA-type n=1 Tax=Penicillium soppii TaxID=69789 RepID=UPI002546AE77|nr:calcium-translocating P-type ATPase PMCA-type [Penicillium soppii]KAJ5856672.1 calcium-translocating P-type ATPase PMCA-type [Penicillium soppii]
MTRIILRGLVSDEFIRYDHIICSMKGTVSGVCTATVTGKAATFPGTTQITSLPVTMTAGASISSSDATPTKSESSSRTSGTNCSSPSSARSGVPLGRHGPRSWQ